MRQIRVQHEPLDPLAEQAVLNDTDGRVGAVVSFTGLMRTFGAEGAVDGMVLEHYPGMTEQALEALAAQAERAWPLTDLVLVHRVGRLAPGDPIVFVGVGSAHHAAAFRACEFLIDALKTRVPLWKKETSGADEHWVEARASDEAAARRWDETTTRDPE
ncbi:molybdenum cofactor biosynthesis protein MoaE [Marichromatium purpuratum 984]|uniref:Molybdopterin synthase catalytic subunit n=1 Tax=Marichromatium purpuratum 984 TaxID=765910 RepID=W0E003_MARPU|nr:molybdenum cofactor biosynthesis protein MoaE [Marichromatium purpuratum]AHF02441.1 molybdenum cofactor biosynthesis protein MoaE [Marichromatium purpuratum 984]